MAQQDNFQHLIIDIVVVRGVQRHCGLYIGRRMVWHPSAVHTETPSGMLSWWRGGHRSKCRIIIYKRDRIALVEMSRSFMAEMSLKYSPVPQSTIPILCSLSIMIYEPVTVNYISLTRTSTLAFVAWKIKSLQSCMRLCHHQVTKTPTGVRIGVCYYFPATPRSHSLLLDNHTLSNLLPKVPKCK